MLGNIFLEGTNKAIRVKSKEILFLGIYKGKVGLLLKDEPLVLRCPIVRTYVTDDSQIWSLMQLTCSFLDKKNISSQGQRFRCFQRFG